MVIKDWVFYTLGSILCLNGLLLSHLVKSVVIATFYDYLTSSKNVKVFTKMLKEKKKHTDNKII